MSKYSARIVSDLRTQFDKVQNVRRDFRTMRQLYTDFMKQTKDTSTGLRAQTQARGQNMVTKMEELQVAGRDRQGRRAQASGIAETASVALD